MARPPLSIEAFADKLRIQSVKWHLQRYDELSGLGSGQIIAAQLSPPKWMADVSMAASVSTDIDHALGIQALVESLDGSLRAFYLYAPQSAFPQADPTGSILGSSSPTLHTIGADNRSIRIGGLPSGYTITAGDMLAFDYGSNPTRRALHRVVETATASGGVTPLFEIAPPLRAGASTGAAIHLRKPAAKMVMVPGSFDPGTSEGASRISITTGMSFQAMQTL